MAVYWIDPHTTTNGSGTYASPYSISSSTRTALVSGDEVRIKSVYLSSLLNATVYTATYTSNYTLTITAGGSLGTDFSSLPYIYFPQYGTFAKVYSVSSNVIYIGDSTTIAPFTTTAAITNLQIQIVNTTTYGVSTSGTSGYFLASNTVSNISVTDGWVSETVRVTDGSAVSLIRSGTTGTTYYIDHPAPTGSNTSTNLTYDLSNTHFVIGTSASTNMVVYFRASNATLSVGGMYSYAAYASANLTIGATTIPVYNSTITLRHNALKYGSAQFYAVNSTINFTNTYTYYGHYIFSTSRNSLGSAVNTTVNFTNLVYFTDSGSVIESISTGYSGNTINITGKHTIYSNNTLSYLLRGTGLASINFGSSFTSYRNREASQHTSVGYMAICSGTSDAITGTTKVYLTPITKPATWTITTGDYYTSSPFAATTNLNIYDPVVSEFISPSNSLTISNGQLQGGNILVRFTTGADPYELLAITGTSYTASPLLAYCPKTYLDNTTVRTSGYSIRTYLPTRFATYWRDKDTTSCKKTIKFPVNAGSTTTVTGYVRTDSTTYSTGDCRMRIFFGGSIIATASITTGCINAWEQFTLTVPSGSTSGEALLVMDMYFNEAQPGKSFWLDDISIS